MGGMHTSTQLATAESDLKSYLMNGRGKVSYQSEQKYPEASNNDGVGGVLGGRGWVGVWKQKL